MKMQLAHLIPHLDAEISRLQRARDLLASTPFSAEAYQPSITRQPVREKSPALQVALVPPLEDRAAAPVPHEAAPREAAALQSRLARKEHRDQDDRRSEPREGPGRLGRRRRGLVVDTALRSSVPSGPIVVSAEEVRRSQEVKAAQATRVADMKKAGAELVSHFGWRSRANDVRSVDALLQRLINIGDEDADRSGASQAPLLVQS